MTLRATKEEVMTVHCRLIITSIIKVEKSQEFSQEKEQINLIRIFRNLWHTIRTTDNCNKKFVEDSMK